MKRASHLRVTPGAAIGLIALFFALGGSAFAVQERAQAPSVAQQRCANGAVRGIAVVTGIASQGIANIPDSFTSAGDLLRAEVQLHRPSSAGATGQHGRLRGPVRRNLGASGVGSAMGDAVASVQPTAGDVFRVAVHPAGIHDAADLAFTLVVV